MRGRQAFGQCEVCEEKDRLHLAPGRNDRLCAICIEGRGIGINGKDELSTWSAIQRKCEQTKL
jgi:hypothetical protein